MTNIEKPARRVVSDKEFNVAWANKDNSRLIACEAAKYKMLDSDQRQQCGMQGLWRALQYHNPQHPSGQRFTTTLYRFVHWECRRELERIARERKLVPHVDIDEVPEERLPHLNGRKHHSYEAEGRQLFELVKDRMTELPRWMRKLLHQYYMERRSLKELAQLHKYSREVTRKRLAKSVERLRLLCEAGVLSDSDSPL